MDKMLKKAIEPLRKDQSINYDTDRFRRHFGLEGKNARDATVSEFYEATRTDNLEKATPREIKDRLKITENFLKTNKAKLGPLSILHRFDVFHDDELLDREKYNKRVSRAYNYYQRVWLNCRANADTAAEELREAYRDYATYIKKIDPILADRELAYEYWMHQIDMLHGTAKPIDRRLSFRNEESRNKESQQVNDKRYSSF